MISDFLVHAAFNASCVAMILAYAGKAHGRLARKLTAHVKLAVIVYGAIALVILVTRVYFSRSIFFGSFLVSVLGGALLILMKNRAAGLRVALIAPEDQSSTEWGRLGNWISDPKADLRGYDLVLVTYQGEQASNWTEALARAALSGAEIRHVVGYLEETKGKISVEHFLISDVSERTLSSYRGGKRVLDVLATILILPGGLVFLGLGILGIWLTMGSPIFFVQARTGLGGRTFNMYKLRTMRASKASEVGTATAKDDVRITRFGAFLRRFRIDELPQLWNVLAGDMSLIGPRPEQPSLTKEYVRHMPAFAYRHLVRPGITGWAQVRAGYAADLEETREKLSYDLFYVKNLSLALDMQIIVRTFWTIASGTGVR